MAYGIELSREDLLAFIYQAFFVVHASSRAGRPVPRRGWWGVTDVMGIEPMRRELQADWTTRTSPVKERLEFR